MLYKAEYVASKHKLKGGPVTSAQTIDHTYSEIVVSLSYWPGGEACYKISVEVVAVHVRMNSRIPRMLVTEDVTS